MIRSDELGELSAALSAAQGEFEAVSKTANNPFFKSKYAALPDVVAAATPILKTHGLAVWQGSDTDARGEVLWTVVLHKSGQYIGSCARLMPVKNDPQAQGSAVTYQRRYQYMAALGLVADVDDDGNAASSKASSAKPSRPRPAATPPAAQPVQQGEAISMDTLEELSRLMKAVELKVAQWRPIAAEIGAPGKKPNELTEDQGVWAVIRLQEVAKAKAADSQTAEVSA